ncbi:hypothetical protein [Thermoanaerobacterium sp. R66]|uniref:hypothetical protein n=1 Tax=Thermoanaerobacterium sp. R66 TaxID=2742479 RepID=UPI0023802EC3|nr:hypothetical protein [Thermoanaerobacterium sp. R66]
MISDVTSETNMVISKVKSGLNAGLNDFLLNAPRTKVNANGSYYFKHMTGMDKI